MAEQELTGCLIRIRGVMNSLNAAEKKVAHFMLGNPESVIKSSVSEVAMGSGVSDATVVRFARTLGYKGFQDLKITLARDLVAPIQRIQEDLSEKDDTGTIARKVFRANIQTLEDTLEVLNVGKIQEAAALLARARKVLLIGVGTSAPNTLDAFNKLTRAGLDCKVQTDSHLQVVEASLLGPDDVALAVSHSGSTKDPIETLEAARKAGAKTIAITNNSLSPITRVAYVVLVTASRETRFRQEAKASRIAQAVISDVLATAVSMTHPDRAIETAKRIEDAIVVKQY